MTQKYKVIFSSMNIEYVELNESLIDDYLIMLNDESVQKMLSPKRQLYTYEQELAWVKRKREKKAIIFSMLEKTTSNFIGNIELMDVTDETAELGIVITPTYQNKHYGTEAIKAIIDYAADILKLSEITLIVYSNNKKAIHCYEKLGFKEYKVEKNIARINGELVDDIYMKLNI